MIGVIYTHTMGHVHFLLRGGATRPIALATIDQGTGNAWRAEHMSTVEGSSQQSKLLVESNPWLVMLNLQELK